jgi:hypothetical protein
MRINKNLLKKELANQGLPILEKKIMPRLKQQFEKAKKAALQAFEDHPVTQEIEAGKNSGNNSGTLGGEGSLYSFIGFGPGEDPIGKLREFLSSKISIVNKGARKSDMVFYITIDLPSVDDVAQVTPLPWAPGRSWAEGIEKGLSGLGNYLVKEHPTSRSGGAVQVQATIRNSSFSTTPYLTKIISDLIKALQQNISIS